MSDEHDPNDELATEVNDLSAYLGGRGTRVISRTEHKDVSGHVYAVSQEYENALGHRFTIWLYEASASPADD